MLNSLAIDPIKRWDVFCSSIIYLFAVLFVAAFTAKSLQIHGVFGTFAYDLGIFDQHLWLLSQLEPAFNTVRGIHGLGDHFRPIEYIFAPLYRLFPSVFWLFLFQTLSVAIAGLILFRFTLLKTSGNRFLASCVSISFFINPVVHNTLLWQYHGFVLTSGLAMGLIYFYSVERFRMFAITLCLLLLCREDVGFITAAFGVFALLQKRWAYAAISILLSVIWVTLALKWIMPYFNGEGYFRHVDGPLSGVVAHAFDWKYYADHLLYSPESRNYLFLIFYPLAFLPILGGVYLIPAIPVLLINMLIGSYYIQINYHYLAMTMPFIYAASVIGIAKIVTPVKSSRYRAAFSFFLGITLVTLAIISFNQHSMLHPSQAIQSYKAWQNKSELRNNLELLKKDIANSEGVAASDGLVPHLSQRRHIYLFPNPWKQHYWGIQGRNPHHPNNVDWIVISPDTYSQNFVLLHYLEESGLFKKVSASKDLIVLNRIAPENPNRPKAVAEIHNYFQNAKGLQFQNIYISPLFPEQPENFNRTHIDPEKCFPDANWKTTQSTAGSLLSINFNSLFNSEGIGSAYVCATINSDKAQSAILMLGSDDGLTVWLNGTKKLENLAFRAANLGDDLIQIYLTQGTNHFVFRVNNIGGAWRLLAKLKPTDGS